LADSLELEYQNGKVRNGEKLKILETIAFSQTDVIKILKYSDELIKLASSQGSQKYRLSGYSQKGNAYKKKGDLDLALKNYFIAAKIASTNNFEHQFGSINISIADVYSAQGNFKNAIPYHKKAIAILRKIKSYKNLAGALLNLGDAYTNNNILDSAEVYTLEAYAIYEKINSPIGIAYNRGNLGIINVKNGDNRKAERNIKEAIAILEELGDYYPISVYLTYMYDLYKDKGDTPQALKYLNESLEIAKKYQLKDQISDAHLKLSEHFQSEDEIESLRALQEPHYVSRQCEQSANRPETS
jgi:adenylate cyclase